jgi:hypothetical protein
MKDAATGVSKGQFSSFQANNLNFFSSWLSGCAFVKYNFLEHAQLAISALNERYQDEVIIVIIIIYY